MMERKPKVLRLLSNHYSQMIYTPSPEEHYI